MYGNKTKTSEKIVFTSDMEIKQYLEDLFSNLNESQEYNIFLHQVNGYYDNMLKLHGKEIMLVKMNNLMQTSLNLSNYSSLSGTSMLKGSTKDINIDSILNYNYYNDDYKVICIIAIPKYINIDNEMVEFSSYKGIDAWEISEELSNKYKKEIGYIPSVNHRKCSMFDAVKQLDDLPKEYMLGVLIINNKENEYKFFKSSTHFGFLSQEEQENHNKDIATKIKNLFKKYNTKDIEEKIVKEYLKLEKYYEGLDIMDI